MTQRPDEDFDNPAEQRLLAHLGALREDAPAASRELVVRVVRRARWQRAVRGPLLAVSAFASALVGGLGALIGSAGRRTGTKP